MSFLTFLLITLIIFTWLGIYLWNFLTNLYRRRLLGSKLYGPKANLLLGNLLMFPKSPYDWTTFFIDQSSQAIEKGQSIIRWWVGFWRLAIWIVDAESTAIILEHSTEISKGRDYEFFEQWLGKGLLLSDGFKWRKQRKWITPIFHFSMTNKYSNVFNQQAKILVEKLLLFEGKGQQDIAPLITRCTLDIIGEAVMGIELKSQQNGSPNYVNAVSSFNHLAHIYNTNLFKQFKIYWEFSGMGKQTRKAIQTLKEFSKKVINEKNNKNDIKINLSSNKKQDKSLMGLLYDMMIQGKLSKDEIREQTDTFLFAGHDTTSSALGWTLWCLACHPNYQERLRNEILNVKQNLDEEFNSTNLSELNYLDRCIKESLRLFPPVPVIERCLHEDLIINEKLIPKGTMIIVSPMILHHQNKVYPNHWEFNPDNFLPENLSKRNAFDFIPFSAGPRNCIGQKFALLELKIVLTHILCNMRLKTDIPFLSNRPSLEAILKPEFGFPVQIESIL